MPKLNIKKLEKISKKLSYSSLLGKNIGILLGNRLFSFVNFLYINTVFMFIFLVIMMKFLIRKAIPDDAYGITYVNVYTRKTTYQGLLPDSLIENRIKNIDERANKMREIIKENGRHIVLEDTETQKIVGMLSCCPSRNQEYPNSGEIMAIYVLKEYQKLGLGKKLFFAGINELIRLGYKDMIINVLKGNDAINFYKKYGGIVVGERCDEVGKFKLHEDILYFKDIESIH